MEVNPESPLEANWLSKPYHVPGTPRHPTPESPSHVEPDPPPTTYFTIYAPSRMQSSPDVHIDTLTDHLLVRIQLLRFRTHRLRSWRALHGQILKSCLPGRRLLPPKAVHRAVVIVVAGEDEPMPIWVN